ESIVIDLRDSFFTISLHPDDYEKFAFSVLSINRQATAKRYHWTVLPQGMKNSPTICQWYVDLALKNRRHKYPDRLIYHYTDSLLISAPTLEKLQVLQDLEV
ncbi:POK25 protein, partial [Todus mexicanus]|nr:POK25 protein [Todus mexicanus]